MNAVIFNGEKVLIPEELQDVDSDVSQVIELQELTEHLARRRDVVKSTPLGETFAIIGIENQTAIHYAMPLRTLLYDVLGYTKECSLLAKKNKGTPGLSSAEFLSGLKKDDRLTPIITLVIYYSEDPWDGPLSLQDMLTEMTPEIRKLVTDHKLNLLQVKESAEYHFSNPEVEKVFSISRDLFDGKIAEVQEEYKDKTLPSEVVRMIGSITGAKTFMKQEEGEEINMCRALEAYVAEKMEEAAKEAIKETENKMCKGLEAYVAKKMEEAVKEASIEAEKQGIGIGIISSMRAMNATTEQIISQLMQQLGMSEERAREYLNQ
ncbi:MAG: hypothetical protein R3Y58_03485 [Eubacteriales bacterium]